VVAGGAGHSTSRGAACTHRGTGICPTVCVTGEACDVFFFYSLRNCTKTEQGPNRGSGGRETEMLPGGTWPSLHDATSSAAWRGIASLFFLPSPLQLFPLSSPPLFLFSSPPLFFLSSLLSLCLFLLRFPSFSLFLCLFHLFCSGRCFAVSDFSEHPLSCLSTPPGLVLLLLLGLARVGIGSVLFLLLGSPLAFFYLPAGFFFC
jgi:hypothetical protein